MILIGFGALLLLNNFNVLSWNIWEVVFRLWPVLLIAVGLDLVFGRRSAFGSLLVAAITVTLLGAGIWYYAPDLSTGQALAGETISEALGGAERAEIQIGGSVGTLQIGATESEQLIEGQIDLARNERVVRDLSLDGDTAEYTLNSRGGNSGWFFNFRNEENRTWDLRLNQDIPMDLSVDTGVGRAILNLEQLDLTSLTVNLGAGETLITLPREGEFEAEVDGGVGQVTIRIPEGMAARIHVDRGIGNVDVDRAFDSEGDNTYLSPNYSRAENRVDLEVNVGVGQVKIEEVSN
jgi:hypothetical protein